MSYSYVADALSLVTTRDLRLGDIGNPGISERVVISLATTPARAASQEIFEVLDALMSQRRRARKIYLALPLSSESIANWEGQRRSFVNAVKRRCGGQVEVVGCEGPGPAAGLAGLLDHAAKTDRLASDDVIVVVEDEVIYTGELVRLHELCHDLYQCDVAVVDRDDVVESFAPLQFREFGRLFSDDNKYNISSWLSFSIRYGKTAEFPRFCTEAVAGASVQGDEVFSAYLASESLYATNIKCAPVKAVLRTEVIRALAPARTTAPVFCIPARVAPRSLQNCSEFSFIYHGRSSHLVAHYLGSQQIAVTVTLFSPELIGSGLDVAFGVASELFKLSIRFESSKFTILIGANHAVFRPQRDDEKDVPVVQTNSNALVSRNKFYSVCTILNHTPAHEYLFFDEAARRQFGADLYPPVVVQAYDSLIPRTYRADLFRYLFAYKKKCIYFDVKMVLNVPISTVYDLDQDGQVYVQDCHPNDVYTAFFISRRIRTTFFKSAITLTVYRIIWNDYGDSPLGVTGPGILGLARAGEGGMPPLPLFNGFEGGDWQNTSAIRDENGVAIVNCSYPGYYQEDNYQDKGHYNNLWNRREVFRYPPSHFFDGFAGGADGILKVLKRI